MDKLNLKGVPESICLLCTKEIRRQDESENVDIEISGMNEPSVRYPKSVNLVESLNLPEQSLQVDEMKRNNDTSIYKIYH